MNRVDDGPVVVQPEFGIEEQVASVVGAADPERGAHLAGTIGPMPARDTSTPLDHEVFAPKDEYGAHEHRLTVTHRAGHDVRAPVQAVGAVDVEGSRRPEHAGVAGRAASEGMAGRIVPPAVGLHLDDPALHAVSGEDETEQARGDLDAVAAQIGGAPAPQVPLSSASGPTPPGPSVPACWYTASLSRESAMSRFRIVS